MLLKAYYSSDIFQINSHVPMIYYEPYCIKLLLLNVKNQTLITFAVACVSVTTPHGVSLFKITKVGQAQVCWLFMDSQSAIDYSH